MTRIIALAAQRAPQAIRPLLVCGCGLALIAAGAF
jgi:hypothetical protein